jgi:hypothetical protein
MTFADEKLLDEVTTAIGELLQCHQQLTEAFFERQGLEQAQAQIEKKRLEIQKLRDRLKKTRDAIHRRRELEQLRKRHEKEAKSSAIRQPQTEVAKNPAGTQAITDQRGRVIGYRLGDKNRTTYLSPKGQVVAREVSDQTYDARGKMVGRGLQGLRILGQRLPTQEKLRHPITRFRLHQHQS